MCVHVWCACVCMCGVHECACVCMCGMHECACVGVHAVLVYQVKSKCASVLQLMCIYVCIGKHVVKWVCLRVSACTYTNHTPQTKLKV